MLTNLDYISYPLPQDIERLVYSGDLKRANEVISLRLGNPKVPECLKERLRFQLRINDSLPRTYCVSEEEMFSLLKKTYRDFTRDEMETLRDDGTLDWAYIDGKVFFSGSALASALKTRLDLQPRLISPEDAPASKKPLDDIIARMKGAGRLGIRFRVRCTLTPEAGVIQEGETVRVHIPLPVLSGGCTPGDEILTIPAAKKLSGATHSHRSAYFEEKYAPGMSFSAEYSWSEEMRYICPDPKDVSPEQPSFDTGEEAPQIRFTPFIRALCDELRGEETNSLIIARRFYDYCTTNTCYRYVPPYYTITNIPEYFGAGQRADCGMHALLFITLCRCAGIPAQWEAGQSADSNGCGCHDWARFYIAPFGWLYCDGSFGGAAYRAGNMERWNFYFGNLEPWRLVLCNDIQQEFDPPKRFPRRDPYDNQLGEIETEKRGLRNFEYDTSYEILEYEEF